MATGALKPAFGKLDIETPLDDRTTYNPFLLDEQTTASDWISELELDTAEKMARQDLLTTSQPLRILILYGSLRKRSYSKLMAFEASRILHRLGCDVRVYNPTELPIKNDNDEKHHKVQELRDLSRWSDGHVWCTPEQHGILVSVYSIIKPLSLLTLQTGVFKNQIDWIPLSTGSVRPTQGRTLSVIQVNGGSQSFNAVNALRILGRWMRMFCIPNQSSLPMAYTQFTDEGDETSRLKPSGNRDRLVDCMEELVKYTIIMRPRFELFGDRFSERKERKAKLAKETVDADKTREAATKAEEMETAGVGAEVQSNVNGKAGKVADNVNGVNVAGI